MSKEMNDKAFDLLIEKAFVEYAAESVSDDPGEAELEQTFPRTPEHDRFAKKLRRLENKRHRFEKKETAPERRTAFVFRRAAVILLILILLSAGAVITAMSSKSTDTKQLVLFQDGYVEFRFDESENECAPHSIKNLVPHYIPDGFELTERIDNETLILCDYEDKSGKTIRIALSENEGNNATQHDIDTSNFTELTVNGLDGCMFYNKSDGINYSSIVLFNKYVIIEVFANLKPDEIVEIARNIK